MKIPIVQGIFTDDAPSARVAYPINLTPVVQNTGVNNGYLRPSDGIVQNGTGPGTDRGGINWEGTCYRVMGTKLVSVASDGTVTTLGDVGGTDGLVSMDYSFDRLSISSNNNLFYWDGSTLSQVTDTDLGDVVDHIFIEGYFMTTDGENLVVTELNDPNAVIATKYGSSEFDPDPVKGLLRLRNEAIALNRYTIEYFDNVGGTGFPFQRIDGAEIQKGAVGTHACAIYMDRVAFVGGGRNEPNYVYLAVNGQALKISSRSIDDLLYDYTETQLSTIKMEVRKDRNSELLYIHLPDQTIVYDAMASEGLGSPVWHRLSSGLNSVSQYQARNFVFAYNQWLVGDPTSSKVGYFDDTIGSHWGSKVSWEFSTPMLYNEGKGALVHDLELVSLTGRTALGDDPYISTSFSLDGLTWSNDKRLSSGTIGNRTKQLKWYKNGKMDLYRIQRFRGDTDAHISFIRLEATLEVLAS